MALPILDYSGAIFSFTSTILYTRNNVWAWIVCIIASLINLYLYYITGIFADASLELVYFALALYGIWYWMYGGINKTEIRISHAPANELIICSIFAILGFIYIYYVLITHSNSNIAMLDSAATVLSLCGQWLMCRRYLETWVVWFFVDCLLAAIFWYKNLPAHLVLNLLYLPIAYYGYCRWSKIQASLTNI